VKGFAFEDEITALKQQLADAKAEVEKNVTLLEEKEVELTAERRQLGLRDLTIEDL
jgi:hypothetical protein